MARRGGGRKERIRVREAAAPASGPPGQARRAFAPIELLAPDEIEAVHRASLAILRDTGIHIMSAPARAFLARHDGVSIDEGREVVHFEPAFVEEAIASVPSQFTLHARNPARSLRIGGDWMAFTNMVTPPYSENRERGLRDGSLADMEELLRLCQMLDTVEMLFGYPVEPQDLDPETRHLDGYRAHAVLTDKPWRGYTLGDNRIRDALEIARIARGIDHATMEAEPSLLANVTTNSPLRIDEPMADGLMLMAEAMQPVSITSFAMAGAISPITLSGSLAVQNAEILAALTLSQLARPGAPAVYGCFTTNVHMRSGAIAFGNPELAKAMIASGQLARRYGLPFKAAMGTGSKLVDAQAGFESQFGLWAAVAAGGHLMVHANGFMESALTVSYEKLIVDAEMVRMMRVLMEPVAVDAESLALDTIHQVGPGGHYFDTPHTIARYETAFYEPVLADWDNRANWEERGALGADVRATAVWKDLLERYEAPALDPARAEEIDAYVARRRIEIAAGTAA